jgi:serine/threonine-protein kinase
MVRKWLDVAHLEPATVLMDKYRVVSTLGVGGMGAVLACEHLTLGNMVAIKFLLPAMVSNEPVVHRFMLEAKAATKIKSDHVAKVLDVGRMTGEGCPDEGIPFMVMEYLEGKDLQEWCKSGRRFTVEEAIDYMAQAGEALAQAHRQGIIHRDVKPANLFLAEYEKRNMVKVLDFGISKLMDEDPREMQLTKTSTVLGSGLYMSPEQMRSAKKVDHRTDIYSLGVCMYELLTGTQPFTAETFSELCVKVNMDPPTPIREHRPDLSLELTEVLAKAYARDPNERYQTVQEFIAALEPFAGEATSLASIETAQSVTSSRLRRSDETVPSSSSALSQTSAGALSSTFAREKRRSSPIGMAIAVGLAGLLLATGVGLLVTQRRDSDAAAAASGEAAAAPSGDAEPEEEPSREPPEPEPAAAPSSSASTSASASTSTSASAAASASAQREEKLCSRLDPDRGTMVLVPCH